MKSIIALLALEAAVASAQKVVHWPIARNAKPVSIPRRVKRDTVTETITNAQTLYYANVSVGTPGQPVSLQLDTGSSDVWVVDSNADCQQEGQNICTLGTFNPSSSSTYDLLDRGGFNISYVDGSGSTGDEFSDVFSIGGTTVNNLTMGLATQTTIGVGIIGVSFPQDESICAQEVNCQTYPTLVQTMVNQSKINSQAYSLWLDDLASSTGSLLFGGIDTSKYTGSLVALPIVPDAPDLYTAMRVAWTGLSFTTPKGEVPITPSGYLQPAILDSGTTTIVLPENLFQQVAAQFGAVMSREAGVYVAPCYVRDANATMDFAFGGTGGPVIKVAVSEFLLDLPTNPRTGQPPKFQNGPDKGQDACEFGVESASAAGGGGEVPILLGDTFLRSAYVVYDLDNKEIAIAQSNFNSGSSHVVEIPGGGSAIPSVASTATAATISDAQQSVGPVGSGIFGSGSIGSLTASASAADGTPSLAAYTTASYTGGSAQSEAPASGSSAASSSSFAMRGTQAPSAAFETGLFVFLMTAFGVVGSGMVLL